VAPYFIDWSQYRSEFEREASRLLGQSVKVAGAAKARLLPFPSVTFEDVRVGDADEPAVVAQRFSMDAELAPFLSGEVLIFNMRLEKPVIALDLDDRGLPIWPVPEDSPVSPAQVTLENARIIDGSMVLRDRIAGRDWALTGFDASVSADSLFGPYRISGDGRLNRSPVGFRITTGSLSKDGFSLRTVLDLPRQDIEITMDGRVAEPEKQGDSPYTGNFTVRPQSAGAGKRYLVEGLFEASPRSVTVPEYRAEFGSADDPYVVTGTADLAGGADPRYRVDVRGTQVNLPAATGDGAADEARKGPAPTISGRLGAVQSMLSSMPFPPIPGSINVDLPAVVAGDTTIRDIRLAASPDDAEGSDGRRRWKVSRFEAQLPGRTTIEADGVLQLPVEDEGGQKSEAGFNGNLLLASRQPSGLASWLTGSADEAVRRLPNAGFAARVSITPQRQSVEDLEVVLGPARMRGTLVRVSDPARRNTLDIALTGEEIDFDALEALGAVFVGEGGAARFADHDLDLALEFVRPDMRSIPLDTLHASIRSRDNKTEIDSLSATGLYGASISATASLERSRKGNKAVIDATVLSPEGAELIAGLAQRFPEAGALKAFDAIASRDAGAFADTRLDVVGTFALADGLSGEASVSVSGVTGGTTLSVTTTADGAFSDPEAAKISMNGAMENPAAERLLAQAGLQTFVLQSPGAMTAKFSANGSLFDGMTSSMTLSGQDMVATLDGILTSDILSTGFTGQAKIEAADVEPWVTMLGYLVPGMGLGTVAEMSAAVSHRNGKTVLREIDAVLNGNRIDGDLTVTAPDAVPVVRGDLAIETLDAGQLFAVISGDADASILIGPAEIAMNSRFGEPMLTGHDIEVGITAGDVFLPVGNATINELSANLVYRNNALAFRNMTGNFGGGTIAGNGELQNNGGALLVNAQLTGENVDVAALLPPAAAAMSGKTDLAVQVTASGRSTKALLSSATGSGVLSTREIALPAVRADGFDAMISQADAIGYEITPTEIEAIAATAFLDGEVVLPPAEHPLTIANGKIGVNNAAAEIGRLSISADTSADLATGVLSGTARLQLDPGEDGVAGPQPEIVVSFRSAPEGRFEVERDFSPVTGYLTQRALEREQARVEALQARLLEKQRLRREVQLFRYRKRMRLQSAEEARLRSFAGERVEKAAEESRRRSLAAEEAARRLSEGDAARIEEEVRREREKTAADDAAAETRPAKKSAPKIELDRLLDALPQPVIRRNLDPINESLLQNPFVPQPGAGASASDFSLGQ
jgi:AsmA-like C-terminal region